MLGGKITVPTLNGDDTLVIPEGTQPDSRFRLRGKGMPHVSGRGRGDLYVNVKVEVPTDLSTEQRELVERLHVTMPQRAGEPSTRTGRDDRDERPFFDRVRDMFG